LERASGGGALVGSAVINRDKLREAGVEKKIKRIKKSQRILREIEGIIVFDL
jgi:hypothetical protein